MLRTALLRLGETEHILLLTIVEVMRQKQSDVKNAFDLDYTPVRMLT